MRDICYTTKTELWVSDFATPDGYEWQVQTYKENDFYPTVYNGVNQCRDISVTEATNIWNELTKV